MDFEGLNNINESKSDNLYFISENNMDGKTLQPRIPNNYFTQNGYEENQTKRVCFSTSIDKCLMALSMNCKGKEYYVHQPVGEYTIINPTIKDVPDSKITGEKWITSPVKIKCVSKIKVLDDDGKDGKKFNYGENTAELYGWKWKYINESITNENYFMSKDDKYLNLDKFESGESNICLVVGLDGSNKNQIARKIANNNDALYVNLNLIKNYCLDNVTDSMNIKDNKIFKDYFKTHSNYKAPHGKKYGRAIVVDDYIPKVEEDFVKFMFPYMKKHSKDKFVVVGSQLYRYMSESQIKRYPTVISGTSTIKSMYSHKNDPNRKDNDIYLHTFKDMNGNEYTRPLPGEIESDFMVNYRNDSLKFDKLKNQLESSSIEIDKLLVWFEKPIDKLLNKKIKLYHGSSVDIKEKVINPISINVGATRFSNPRWSTYFWDNEEMAIQWAITWEVKDAVNTECLYRNHDGKTLLVNNTNLSDEKFIDKILSKHPVFYIYETIVPINKLEMGSTAAMPEYTVSEDIKITNKTKVVVTKKMINDYFEIISKEEGKEKIDYNDMDYMSRYRNKFLDVILSNYRDPYRALVKRDIKKGKINVGDDISSYRSRINKAIDDDLFNLKPKKESYYIDRLNDLPFFTSEDLESYSNYYTECDENKEWIDMYKLINIGAFSEDFYEINKNRIETLNELYKDYPNFDDYTKQRIVNLGWNPEVAFSSKNRRIATENTRLRIKKILNESNVVDEDVILESKSNKKPVYLVFTWTETLFGKGIRAVTKGTYTHACISLDKTLNKLYSYNLVNGISKLGGMAIEDLRTYNPNGSVLVFVTYVTEEQHKKLKKVINDLVNNVNKTKYSILNVFGILLNRPIETNHNMVCSQFVDKMMKTIDLDLTNGKNSALVTPVDLYKSTSDKIYKVYEGGIKDFKPNKITKSEKNIKVNEAKLPIEFDSEGNLNINKIVDIQEEYNKSHKLLLNYDKSKNYKAMKEELFKLWALNIKLEKIIYKQKKANKSHYDLRARILNDFNKYIKIVSENEEDFNFSKEFDTSIYNNNSYSISKHTLKHGIQYIKSIFL